MQKGRIAKVFELGACHSHHPRKRFGDRGDPARVALRDRAAMVDSVRGGDHDLRAGVGEHGHEVAVRELKLGDQLGESAGAVFALAFGQVQRLVGGGDQLGRAQRVLRIGRHADAEGQVLAGDRDHGSRVHRVDDAIGKPLRPDT